MRLFRFVRCSLELRLRSVRQSCGSDFSPAIQSHQDHHTLARDCLFAKNSTSYGLPFRVYCYCCCCRRFHPWKWHSVSPLAALFVVSIWDRRVPSLRLHSSAGTIVRLGGGRQMPVSSTLFQQTRSTTLGSITSSLPPLSRRSSNSWAMCSGGTTPRLLCARHRCSARGWHGDTGGLGGGFVGRIASVGGVSWSLVLDGWLALVQEGEGSSSVRGNPPP